MDSQRQYCYYLQFKHFGKMKMLRGPKSNEIRFRNLVT